MHIVNLCAKSVLRPFDVDKRKEGNILDEAEAALQELTDRLDLEGLDIELEENNKGEDDGDGFVDEVGEMDEAECKGLAKNVYPVKLVLVKVWIYHAPCVCILHTLHSFVKSHSLSSTHWWSSSPLSTPSWEI